jgi:tetratricopeptide (TPR) repeat protein
MTRRLATWLPGVALVLLLSTLAARGQTGGSPAPVFKDTDPYEKPERKEPSMWHRPSADTPAAQLALATKYEQAKRRSRAISANRSLVHKWHNAPEAVTAQGNLARLLEEDAEYEDAFLEYQYLITYFAGQFPFLDVLDHQYRCANALCSGKHRFLGISTKSMSDVRRMYERILINGPNWAKAPDVAMRIGVLRESEEEVPEAIAAYELVQNRFPNTEAAHDAAYRAAIDRSQFAGQHPRDTQSRNDAVAALHSFLRKYPNDPLVGELKTHLQYLEQQAVAASYAQAVFYDRNRHDRPAAIAAYRDFQRRYPDAPQAREAAARLLILERSAFPEPKQGVTNEVVR